MSLEYVERLVDFTEMYQIWTTEIIPSAFLIMLIRYLTVKHWFFPIIADKVIISSKYQLDVRKRRIDHVAKLIFKVILYLTLHFYLGLSALQDMDWMPFSFPTGSTTESTSSIYNRLLWGPLDSTELHHRNLPRNIQLYFNLSAAYHLHESAWLLLFEIGHKKFWEMLLHHISTMSLIVLCFICRNTAVGCVVLILHGLTDLPMALVDILRNSPWDKVTLCVFFVTLFSWCYYRVYVFWGSVIQPIYNAEKLRQLETGDDEWSAAMYYVVGFSTLIMLHLFWIGSLTRSGYRFFLGGKAHHSGVVARSDFKLQKKSVRLVQ